MRNVKSVPHPVVVLFSGSGGGKVEGTSENSFPTGTSDRLGLVVASGLTAFRPVLDALTSIAFYDLDPKVMRDLQRPQDGHLPKSSGKNIASVFRRWNCRIRSRSGLSGNTYAALYPWCTVCNTSG